MPRRDVVVVGGGVAGLSLAYELGKRGASVALADRFTAPSGASAVPAALLNPHRGRTARAAPGDRAGLAAFWRLAAELEDAGLDPGARRTGVVRVAATPRQAALWRDLAAAEDGLRWLAPGEAPPAAHAPHGALLVAGGGWVDPAALLAALAAAAERLGATLLRGAEVTGVSPDDAGATVATSVGPLRARHVVLCVGAGDPPPGCRLPRLARDGGVAAVLDLRPEAAARLGSLPPLAGPVNAVFDRRRVVVTGGSLAPDAVADGDLRAAAAGLRDALAWSVPGVADAELTGAWLGVRVRRPSGRPVARRLSPLVTYYGALAGRGFLCAADVSARLAERLTR